MSLRGCCASPRLQAFYGLSESHVFNYVNFLRQSSETVTLDPLLAALDPGDAERYHRDADRDRSYEADILCTTDDDFFQHPANEYLARLGVAVVNDISLIRRLRA